MRSKVMGWTTSSLNTSLQVFAPPSASSTLPSGEPSVPMPAAGVLKNLRLRLNTAPGVGRSRTIAIRRNGVDIATGTISDTNTETTIAGPVSFSTGDLASIGFTPTGTPAGSACNWCMDFQGTTPQQTVLLAAGSASANGTVYIPVCGNQSGGTSAPANETLVGITGTITNMQIFCTAVPSGSRTFTLRKNGVNTAMTCTIGTGGTTGSDSVNSVGIVPGDRLVIVVGGTAVALAHIGVGLAITPSTDGEGMTSCGGPNSPSTTVANWMPPSGANGTWQTSESAAQIVLTAGVIRRLVVRTTNAPGAGNQWNFNLKVNGGYVGLEAVLFDAINTGQSADVDVAVNAGDLITLETIPTSGPASAGRTEYSMVTYQLNEIVASGRSQAVLFI